jgi:hypothetical protein
MKRLLFGFGLLLSSQAFSQSLADRFLEAQRALENLPMQSMAFAGSNLTEAQRRAVEFANETSQVATMVIGATANPTEAAQLRACQHASRALDVGLGARFLHGYHDLQEEFRLFDEALTEVRKALVCDSLWSSDDACHMFVNRAFRSEFVAYNGRFYQAAVDFKKKHGSYDADGGAKGQFKDIRCKDGGLTLSGKWKAQSSSGWFNFYIVNEGTGEYKGSWGDYKGHEQFYQGYWNGQYKY